MAGCGRWKPQKVPNKRTANRSLVGWINHSKVSIVSWNLKNNGENFESSFMDLFLFYYAIVLDEVLSMFIFTPGPVKPNLTNIFQMGSSTIPTSPCFSYPQKSSHTYASEQSLGYDFSCQNTPPHRRYRWMFRACYCV